MASDKDGDNVRFGFVGGGTTSQQFVIEEITGVIRLHSKAIALDRDKYELNVTALDDGSCCVNGDATIHTSTAVVVVFITDVNDNKPVFKDCGTYYPKVEEGAPNGSPVIKVQATDEDKGVNGQVRIVDFFPHSLFKLIFLFFNSEFFRAFVFQRNTFSLQNLNFMH